MAAPAVRSRPYPSLLEVIISTFIQQTFKTASRDEEIMIKETA